MQSNAAAGFVLAGGQSRRMGRDKALLNFAGEPLIEHAIRTLEQAGLAVAIAGDRQDLAKYAPIIQDREHAKGPLGGVCAALQSMEAQWAVFVTVDTPFLPADLVCYLLRHAQTSGSAVTLASVAGEVQTFPAVLEARTLPVLRPMLEAGRLKCISAFESTAETLGQAISVLPAEIIAQTGEITDAAGLSPMQWFFNVNTADEFKQAESWLRHPIA